MQKRSLIHWAVVLIALSPAAYLAIIWNSLPGIVPVHYNLNFKPDRLGNKDELWMLVGVISGVSLLVYLLLLNIRRFDPKQRKLPPSLVFTKLAIVIVVFLAIINFLVLISIKQNSDIGFRALFPLIGLLIAFVGNYLNNLKPNYFAGIRLPWTLSSDYNWRKTHQLAGKLWFWGGLIAAAISVFISHAQYVVFAVLAVITIIPVVYSYQLFKRENVREG